ncbi:CDP-alcohol phosphatidyltransferase family protein [Escherichia coli]
MLFIRMALDALDGMFARECNQQTRLGAILMKLAMLFPIYAVSVLFLPESNALLVMLVLFCTILTEFCGLLSRQLTVFAVMPVHSAKAIVHNIWVVEAGRSHLSTVDAME